MKKNALMMAAVLGMTQVFKPRLPSLERAAVKSKRVIVLNPYVDKKYRKHSRRRDIAPLTKFRASKYMPHQGKQECARRVKQMKKQQEKILLKAA